MTKKLFNYRLHLGQKVLIGMLLGILFGVIFGEHSLLLKPISTVFMGLIKMITVPAVFFAVLYGFTSVPNKKILGTIGLKAVVMYGITTMFAIAIGVIFAVWLTPGEGVNLAGSYTQETGLIDNSIINAAPKKISEMIIDMIPLNPVASMANGKVIQIVVFAFFLGVSLVLAGDTVRGVKVIIKQFTEVIFRLVGLVMRVAPYGVFSIMACVVADGGLYILVVLGKLVLVIIGAYLLQYIVFGCILYLTGLNPLKFYKKTFNIQSLALATSSSKAVLPTTIDDLQKKLGASEQSARFVLPLGATINMDGTAIFLAICALFIAQSAGVVLSTNHYFLLAITSTIGSIGAAGYPSGGIVMLVVVLSALGCPLDGVALILGIDRFVDMLRTTINIMGDCTVTVAVDKINKTLDLKKYND
jgi:Na+/H+-dicarboxylate symporter